MRFRFTKGLGAVNVDGAAIPFPVGVARSRLGCGVSCLLSGTEPARRCGVGWDEENTTWVDLDFLLAVLLLVAIVAGRSVRRGGGVRKGHVRVREGGGVVVEVDWVVKVRSGFECRLRVAWT